VLQGPVSKWPGLYVKIKAILHFPAQKSTARGRLCKERGRRAFKEGKERHVEMTALPGLTNFR
jgi:hypothetical protein